MPGIDLALMLTLLLIVGFSAQWLAWRVKLPAILFLLVAGVLLGPVTGLVEPDQLLGRGLFPFVSLAVALILFEGSLTLRLEELRGIGATVRGLVSYGALAALLMLAACAHYIAGLAWPIAMLFGALACVTGPTVIVPLLRTVRPDAKIANALRWEGIVIDPLGALLAVLMFEAIISREQGHSLGVFGLTIASGAVIGVSAAFLLAFCLRRHLIPEYLQNFGTIAFVLGAFSLSNTLTHESGLLAVTIMGIVVGNQRDVHIDHIMDFKEDLSTLLVSLLFVVLAARLQWPLPHGMLLAGVLIFLVAQFIVRPLSVLLATFGGTLTWRQRVLLGWIAPRGIVAAAVSALFALRLGELHMPGADALVPLVFILIIGTVVVQSATSRIIAVWLRVAEPEPDGVLVFGSDNVARTVAAALKKAEFHVLVVDDDWDGIRAARMAGLETFFGSPTSQFADNHMDLAGIGCLLAMSTRREMNTLAVVHYRPEFGRANVFRLRNLAERERHDRRSFADPLMAPALFSDDIIHARLAELIAAGWQTKSTGLTETFDRSHFIAEYGEESILMFGIDERGKLHVASSQRKLEPKPGWTVIALVPPEQKSADA